MSLVRLLCLLMTGAVAAGPVDVLGPCTTPSVSPSMGDDDRPPETLRHSECTTTLRKILLSNMYKDVANMTKTIHTSTVVSTELFDCHGCCNLAVYNIGGLGPAVPCVTTVTDTVSPATVTTYLCSVSSSPSTGAANDPMMN